MKQKQRNEGETMADDDDWLQAEIQRELDAINSAELDPCDNADDIPGEDELYGEDDVTSEDEPMPASILDYITKVKVQSEKLQRELEDCDTLIEGTSVGYQRKQFEFDEDLQHIAQEEGLDIKMLKEMVIVKLDKEDVDDEKVVATYVGNNVDETGEDICMESSGHVSPNQAEMAVDPTKTDDPYLNGTETAISKAYKISEFTADQKPEVNNCHTSFLAEHTESVRAENAESIRADSQKSDSIKGTISEVVTDDSGSNPGGKIPAVATSQVIDKAGILENKEVDVISSLPDQGAVVLVTDSDILERQLLLQVTQWDQRRRTIDKLREQQLTSRRREEEGHTKEMDGNREEKRQETLEEERRLILQREKTDAEERKKDEEIEKQKEEFQESFALQQRQIDQLIEETRAERNELQQSVEERCVRQEQKKESAATKIQATFRRFRARILYGAAVDEKIEEVRATMEVEKVRKVALQIQARNIEHEKTKNKEIEEKKELERKKQVEAKEKQEIEKKKKEERERMKREEKEKRKREEEEKRKAEEEKKLLEKQRKQKEKQVKMEEAKKKKEEERMRTEAVARRMREEEARREGERRKEEQTRVEEEQETEQLQHRGVCDGQQRKTEQAQQLETGCEGKYDGLLRKEVDRTETQEKLKNNEEEKTKKLDKEPLVPSDGEEKKLVETINKNEKDLRQENGNENKNKEKLIPVDEEDRMQTGERNSEAKGEINLDRQLASQTEQVFERSPKMPQDVDKSPRMVHACERPPEVVQDFRQSTQTTEEVVELSTTGQDCEQSSSVVQSIEQLAKTVQDIEQSGKDTLDIEQSGKDTLDIEQSANTVQEIEKLAKTVPDIEQSQSGNTAPDIEQRNIKTNMICDDGIGADNAKISNKSDSKLDSSCALSATRDWGAYLPDHIDNQRLTWIKDCLSWSKITSALKLRPRRGSSKKPPRRPASANALPSLTEVRLLSATGTTSLQKITTVQLQDLPGCSLSTLSQCFHLMALTLNRCGLVTLEGLEGCRQLSYLDLQDNSIEMVAPLKVNAKLIFVNLSYNCLPMIHGLDGCTNIRYLDLSHNRITRIAGLSDLRRLHTLQLSHNQLISSRGIGELVTLQQVDLSYNLLPRLDDMQQLALLQVLKATGNNLMQVPELSNHVLLQQLLLNDNSISSVRNISQGWCPLLQQLDLRKNSVSLLADLSSCLLLGTLDLTDNQIADLPSLTTALSTMRSIKSINLTGCPVCQEADYRMAVSQALPTLCTLDGTAVSTSQNHSSRTEFEEMCLSQVQQESSLRSYRDSGVEQCTSLADLSQVRRRYFDRSFQLAVNHRQCHEYGELTIDPATTFDLITSEIQPVVSQTADMKALFDEAVLKNSPVGSVINVPRPPGWERPKQLVGRPQSHLLVENTSVSKPTEPCRIMLSREDKAATKIQALWRGHFLRCKIDYYTRMSAAMTIQACWRGYTLRKILLQAMDYARFDDDDNDSIYGAVNMDDFNFSEADLDKGWTPPETPRLPQNHAVLRPPPGSEAAPVPVVPHLFPRSPFPPEEPKQAWRNPDSPFSQRGYQIGAMVPLASLHGEGGSTQRSGLSKKEEQLTEEWGFKEPRTAELMLQRAKKLKYNAVKRKKLRKLDPKQRLALMRRLEHPQLVQPPTRNVVPRTEYFKGRVQADESKAKKDSSDKRLRMFMWLHTQVCNFDDITSSRISNPHGRAESSQHLPLLTPGVIAGRKTQLMGSPNSLEMESLLEGTTREVISHPLAHQRRLSAQDDYTRSRLPQIKTSSAPAVRIKEKMSWRNKGNTRTSGGWGGGRKRSKPA